MAAVGQRYYSPYSVEVDVNGVPIAGARLFFYATGTSTPQDTYADVNLTTPNTNPVVADANGRFPNIWLSPAAAYHVQLWDAATADNPEGVQIWDADPVGPASGGVPTNAASFVGDVRNFAGPAASIPSGWLLCDGSAVSRATYASLFAIIGTTYGAGNGTTTFNLPDARGRVIIGKDDMGGSAASRITTGTAGINGVTLGAAGGDQRMFQHKHALTDPGHTHSVTDPTHVHLQQNWATQPVAGPTNQPPGGGGGVSIVPNTDTQASATGISIVAATTGISMANFGANTTSQNVQPGIIMQTIIYAGA